MVRVRCPTGCGPVAQSPVHKCVTSTFSWCPILVWGMWHPAPCSTSTHTTHAGIPTARSPALSTAPPKATGAKCLSIDAPAPTREPAPAQESGRFPGAHTSSIGGRRARSASSPHTPRRSLYLHAVRTHTVKYVVWSAWHGADRVRHRTAPRRPPPRGARRCAPHRTACTHHKP